MNFICDMGTIQTYLKNYKDMRILAMVLPKFREKVGEGRDKWCDERRERKMNFGDVVAEIPTKMKAAQNKGVPEIGRVPKNEERGEREK